MIEANKLSLLAAAADRWLDASEEGSARKDINLAISEARREVTASNGFGSPSTFVLEFTMDSDREHAKAIQEMIAMVREDASETPAVDLADSLRDYVEHQTSGLTDAPLTSALIQAGLSQIDWLSLARHYLAEAELND